MYKKAVAGIEVRSSAFLIEKYDLAMKEHALRNRRIVYETRDDIIAKHRHLLESNPKRKVYLDTLLGLNDEQLEIISFKSPTWSATEELVQVREKINVLKNAVKELQKRDYLTITPKVEDFKVVNKWIETTGVPHYYVQVFFDKIYGISFENILRMITDADNEGRCFSVESDEKNQNKTTIKINTNQGICIAERVDEPKHSSVRKEMSRGRLLFYVHFDGGQAYLDTTRFETLFGWKL